MSGLVTLPLDLATIVSTSLECIFYGFSVLAFVGTLWSLFSGRTFKEVNKSITVVAVVLLLLSTGHVCVDIYRVQQGFIAQIDQFANAGGPSAYFGDITQPTFIAKNVLYVLDTCVGDAFVIYRAYTVWHSFSIVLLPFLMWFTLPVLTFYALWLAGHATAADATIFGATIGQLLTAAFALTLATNVIATGLLAFRIWYLKRQTEMATRNRDSPYNKIIQVIADSGVLYTAYITATLVAFALQSNMQYLFLDMIPPVISIAFYMIIVRLIGVKTAVALQGTSLHNTSVLPWRSQNDVRQDYTRPMQVRLEHLRETRDDSGNAISYKSDVDHNSDNLVVPRIGEIKEHPSHEGWDGN